MPLCNLYVWSRFGSHLHQVALRRYRHLRVFPASLAAAVACVAISRLVKFEPGYLYGILAGVAFRKELAKVDEGRALAVAKITTLVLSLGAWIAWLPISEKAARPGAGAT